MVQLVETLDGIKAMKRIIISLSLLSFMFSCAEKAVPEVQKPEPVEQGEYRSVTMVRPPI